MTAFFTRSIKISTTALMLIVGIATSQASSQPTELLISEYVEGSSNSKAIEIYNGTGATVDLASYEVQFYLNGSTSASRKIALFGTVADSDVFVLAQKSADPAILVHADQTDSNTIWYNGDDAVVLLKDGLVIDAIGQIGVDPGIQWGSGLTSTQDNTLRRKPSVCAGESDAYNEFDPSLEWEGLEQNTFNGLGSHAVSCQGDLSPPPSSKLFIHDIQGEGVTTSFSGQTVTVEAIVVGDFQGSAALSGFHIQEEDADIDFNPMTSEGIFIYQDTIDTDVNVGDLVSVTGIVTEYFGITEISATAVTVISNNNSLPSETLLNLPIESFDQLEYIEGMRVILPQKLIVTDNYNLGQYGEVWLSTSRLMQPTNIFQPGTTALKQQTANNLNKILIDDGSTKQNTDPIVYPYPELTAFNTLRIGDTVEAITGVMHYAFGEYRIHPTISPEFVNSNVRSGTPKRLSGTLKVASFNVANYFNGDHQVDGFPTARGASTAEEFDRQRKKIIAAITALDADIIGLMEIENDGYGKDSAIDDLVNGLNAAAPPGASYAFIDPGVNKIGNDAIAVGIIYRIQTVSAVGRAKILDSSIDPHFIDTKNRPALAQTFDEIATDGRLTIAVNHLKSKASVCDDVGDPDIGDGQGNCNQTRTSAAQALVDWLATDPTDSGDTDFLIIGDLNSYAMENPITTIKNAGYTDLIDHHLGADHAYTYVHKGQSGYLDHALASTKLVSQITDVTVWHINTDEPRVLDYNVESKSENQIITLYSPDFYRASDHDPILIGVNLDSQVKEDNSDEETKGSGITYVVVFFLIYLLTGKLKFAIRICRDKRYRFGYIASLFRF